MLPIERSVSARCCLLGGICAFSQIHWENMKLFLIRIDVVFQTNRAHKTLRARARLSSPQSAGVVVFFSPPLLFIFYDQSLIPLPLPSTAALERLFLELT